MNKKFFIGLSVGAIFLYLTLRQIDFSSCWKFIKQANLYYIIIAVFVYILAFVIRGIRWKYLLAPVKDIPFIRLVYLLIIGFFMNNLLPLRLGELVRANVAGQKLSITKSGALATIVLERLLDGLTYVFLFLITIIFLPFPEWAKKSMYFGSALFLGGVIFMFFLARHQEEAVKLVKKIPVHSKFIVTIEQIVINFIKGLTIFKHNGLMVIVLLLSVCVWTFEGNVFFFFSRAFGLNLSLFQCFFCMIIIGMGAILPPAPGFVGTVEFLGVTALTFLGVNKNQAFGMIITLHLFQFITVIMMGITSMIKEKVTFQELIQVSKQQ
jgi:hypothetical protein